jgi:uncharacterized metal-binding protein YceD (DUF177 family)
VRISGVGEGNHRFSFDLGEEFFTSFDQPEVQNGIIRADVVLEKTMGFMALHFTLEGEVELICDRCLDPFMTPVRALQTIYVKTGDTPGELEDNVIMIGKEEHEIEVGQLMYEYIVLSLPVQKIHPADSLGRSACDPEMLRRIEALSPGETRGKSGDPRWDALKGIIENNN